MRTCKTVRKIVNGFVSVSFLLPEDIFNFLNGLKNDTHPTITMVVRKILREYMDNSITPIKPVVEEKLEEVIIPPDLEMNIRIAQRAKRAGRDYDKSLEKFFKDA